MAPHVHRSRHHPTDARGIPVDDVHRGDGHLGSYLSLFRSSLKVVNTDNALPIGLAFGYAYAGSVAMLTTVLDDVKTVMMAATSSLTFLAATHRVAFNHGSCRGRGTNPTGR